MEIVNSRETEREGESEISSFWLFVSINLKKKKKKNEECYLIQEVISAMMSNHKLT